MKVKLFKFLNLLVFCTFVVGKVYSKCEIINNKNNQDLLVSLLSEEEDCPRDVNQLKKLLELDGLDFKPAIVANRGFHNPKIGSFSVFESVRGESTSLQKKVLEEHFYFGHFTKKNKNSEIILDQQNVHGKLIIELIVFDFNKKAYNFYELIGAQLNPVWIYRGDSFDIYKDNKNLKIGSSKPSKLRCSACHTSGGPIMKELDYPHSDWWTNKNKLDFGNSTLSRDLNRYVNQFIDASEFAKNVKKGIELIEQTQLSQSKSIREDLKPLFCTTEINLKSDTEMFVNIMIRDMSIPSDIFINPLLVESYEMKLDKSYYTNSLFTLGMMFPEVNRFDAQFGFHSPVKGYSDLVKIKKLIKNGLITKEFALDILAYDMKNPLFSKKRCSLLKLIPETVNWYTGFLSNLKTGLLQKLIHDLETPNISQHVLNAKIYLKEKENSWRVQKNVTQEVIKLDKLRKSVFDDEISKNPRGQILEPGFRVVFPFIK